MQLWTITILQRNSDSFQSDSPDLQLRRNPKTFKQRWQRYLGNTLHLMLLGRKFDGYALYRSIFCIDPLRVFRETQLGACCWCQGMIAVGRSQIIRAPLLLYSVLS